MQTSIATDVLTPSEVVLVNGEKFSKPARDGFPLPRGEAKVDADALAIAAIEAAILANERAGTIRLEEGIRKRLFGLLKFNVIRALPGGAAPEWPAGTYEARIHERVKAAGAGEGIEVNTLVHDLFPADDANPHVEILLQVAAGLRARGLAEVETRETTALKVFKVKANITTLNPAGTALADRHPAEAAQELLAAVTRDRASTWKLLDGAVRSGIGSRREMQDYPDSSSSFD